MQKTIETVIGFTVIAIAIVFSIYIYQYNDFSKKDGYFIYADCSNIEGINEGSNILIAGVKIGKVSNFKINLNNFYASLTLKINSDIKLPKDSYGSIVNSGFLGDKFIAITPGISGEFLKPDDFIMLFPGINLENLLGKMIYLFENKEKK